MINLDKKTILSFGDEWNRFDQSRMKRKEAYKIFKDYFSIFPLKKLSKFSEGFDMGCGSGRWAKFLLPSVGLLHCIDPSDAIYVAKKNLKNFKNVKFHHQSLDKCNLKEKSQDFGYSLGVLHHVPNTQLGLNHCVRLLKPGAPFLLYIYYSFDNRPLWFRFVWTISNYLRLFISKLPNFFKFFVCDILAILIYFPISKFIFLFEKAGFRLNTFPLYFYRKKSFYTMRTDSRDRFGTPLEKRFSKKEIYSMMKLAGLEKIKFKNDLPFWTAIGYKKF